MENDLVPDDNLPCPTDLQLDTPLDAHLCHFMDETAADLDLPLTRDDEDSEEVVCLDKGIPSMNVLNTIVQVAKEFDNNSSRILFHVSAASCSRYFRNTISLLAKVLHSLIPWPDKSEILSNMPACFKIYKKTRVDCTEVLVEKPKCLTCQIQTYSHYKRNHTIKLLVGMAPSGLITHLSSAYGGRASDKFIFEHCGLLGKLEKYVDSVMVDKGFPIDEMCALHGIGLIRLPHLKKTKQFTVQNADKTASIGAATVHVERCIQRLKIFELLGSKIPWVLVGCIDEIFTVCSAIVNLSAPILPADKY